MSPPRGKYWCFTLNNPTPDEIESLSTAVRDQEDLLYLTYGRETGSEGTPHLQGYLELAAKLRLGGVRKLRGLGRGHFELRRGTQEQAIAYCHKADQDPFEDGVRFSSKQGNRVDLESLKALIDSGATESELADAHFGSYIRYGRGIERYRQLRAPRVARAVDVYVLWGAPGTGKTRFVFEREPLLWISSDPTLQWFDGYQGEPAALIDDFTGSIATTPAFLLRLLDRYPTKVPIKGGFVQWVPERIYITSNQPPPFGMENTINVEALLRRIKKTVFLETLLDFEDREVIDNLLE